jgi:hypothetical protein
MPRGLNVGRGLAQVGRVAGKFAKPYVDRGINYAKRKGGEAMGEFGRAADEAITGFGIDVINTGTGIVNTGIAKMKEKVKLPKGKSTKPTGGSMNFLTIESPAVGSTTDSVYKSKVKSNITKSTREAIKLGQRYVWEMQNSGYLQAAVDSQATTDTANNANASTYAYEACFWGGNNGNTTSINPQKGVFEYLFEGLSVNYDTGKYYFESCDVETTFTNGSTTACTLEIWEVVAKHDFAAEQYTLDTTNPLASGSNAYSPNNYWIQGLLAAEAPAITPVGVSGGLMTPTTPGAVPFDSELFNQYWKVAHRQTVNLTAGALHRHKSHYTIDQLMHPFRWRNATLLQGLTRSHLYTVIGQPVASGTTGTSVSLSGAKVNYVQNVTYRAAGFAYSKEITYATRTYAQASSATRFVSGVTAGNIVSGAPGSEVVA